MSNVLMISSDQMGQASEDLGKILMKSYIATLVENNSYETIILVNSGVKIVCSGSNIIADLEEITKKTTILICQTCLNYYELEDKVEVGTKSNMIEIAKVLTDAKKVVNL